MFFFLQRWTNEYASYPISYRIMQENCQFPTMCSCIHVKNYGETAILKRTNFLSMCSIPIKRSGKKRAKQTGAKADEMNK